MKCVSGERFPATEYAWSVGPQTEGKILRFQRKTDTCVGGLILCRKLKLCQK